LEYFKQNQNYLTLYKIHPFGGSFLVSWISPWQIQLLENAEEWCKDPTQKTCVSFTNQNDDAYLFTIVVKSRITNKGVPVCFFLTDAEKQ
jgi:hypothetical protein